MSPRQPQNSLVDKEFSKSHLKVLKPYFKLKKERQLHSWKWFISIGKVRNVLWIWTHVNPYMDQNSSVYKVFTKSHLIVLKPYFKLKNERQLHSWKWLIFIGKVWNVCFRDMSTKFCLFMGLVKKFPKLHISWSIRHIAKSSCWTRGPGSISVWSFF